MRLPIWLRHLFARCADWALGRRRVLAPSDLAAIAQAATRCFDAHAVRLDDVIVTAPRVLVAEVTQDRWKLFRQDLDKVHQRLSEKVARHASEQGWSESVRVELHGAPPGVDLGPDQFRVIVMNELGVAPPTSLATEPTPLVQFAAELTTRAPARPASWRLGWPGHDGPCVVSLFNDTTRTFGRAISGGKDAGADIQIEAGQDENRQLVSRRALELEITGATLRVRNVGTNEVEVNTGGPLSRLIPGRDVALTTNAVLVWPLKQRTSPAFSIKIVRVGP